MINRDLVNDYFEWLYNFTIDKDKRPIKTYRKLLMILHDTEFIPIVEHDENRAQDGIDLRWRFSRENRCKYDINNGCSVLEMMIALSLRCEEQIMDDPDIGNRTSTWFWLMIRNLGLFRYSDDYITNSSRRAINRKLDIFMNREYESNGEGGLFIIENCRYDLRRAEIWYQMCWYLNSLM